MILNYNHLYYFHVAAVEGSVAAAAQRLGVRQPTVSEQLRALEKVLGSDLFERTQTGLRLTEAGRLTFEHTTRMFRVGERIGELVTQGAIDVSRVLRIGVSGGIARSTKTDFLLPLLALADCVPSVRTAEAVDLLRELRGGMLDLVLCEIEPPEGMRRGLQTTVVDRTQLVAIAPPSVQPAADWKNVGFAHYRASSAYRWEVSTFLDSHGLQPRIVAESDDSLFLVEVSVRAPCVAIVPRTAAKEALLDGRVRVVAELDSGGVAVHALYQDNIAAGLTRSAVEMLVRAYSEPSAVL